MNESTELTEATLVRLRAAPALYRHALRAMCDGAQLVLRYGQWEAYAEERGKVVPLGLKLSERQLKDVCHLVPDAAISAVIHVDPAFSYMPARNRDDVRDLLTQSMPTQHLLVELPVVPRRERESV